MRLKVDWIFVMITVCLTAGCIDPYNLPPSEASTSFIVIDGQLDNASGNVSVRLTRTVPLESTDPVPTESGASVQVSTSEGDIYSLFETAPGVYSLDGVFLDPDETCKLQVQTASGNVYESSQTGWYDTPDIDSLTYATDNEDGLVVHVTTHDPTGKAEFYRWEYIETYEYTSAFRSSWYYDSGSGLVNYRPGSPLDNYRCWNTTRSTRILVASSRNLAESIVYKYPLTGLPPDSYKMRIKYSLLVQQTVIDEAEYTYWNELKKSTETVGSIFDPQPSRVLGNIVCITNPSEPVLGYFSVGAPVESRIFIDRDDIPFNRFTTPFSDCLPVDIDTILLNEFWLAPELYTLYEAYYSPFGQLIGYTTGSVDCADCRIRVPGTTTRPNYWE